jgi:hypothetical protein
MTNQRRTIFALALVLAVACAGEYSPREKLATTTLKYYEAFRWNKPAEMQSHVVPGMQVAFRKDYEERFKDIKIVDYEITETQVDASKKSARVTVAFAWHTVDETYIHEAIVIDTWVSKKTVWYCESQEVLSGEVP